MMCKLFHPHRYVPVLCIWRLLPHKESQLFYDCNLQGLLENVVTFGMLWLVVLGMMNLKLLGRSLVKLLVITVWKKKHDTSNNTILSPEKPKSTRLIIKLASIALPSEQWRR